MCAHGSPELRGVVALGIIEFEMLAEPLSDVGIRAFAADVAELSHGIDGGGEIAEMGRMLLHELEMVEEMFLRLFRHIIRPETDLLFGQEAVGKEKSPLLLLLAPVLLIGGR